MNATATLESARPFTLIEGGAPEPELDVDEEWAITVHALAGCAAHYWKEYAGLGKWHLDALCDYRLCRAILQRMVGHELAALMISERM